jgi:hypothetical protein
MTASEQSRGFGRRALAVALALFLLLFIAARVEPSARASESDRAAAQQPDRTGAPVSAVLASHRVGSSVRAQPVNYLDDAESTEPTTTTALAPVDGSVELATALTSSSTGATGARAPPADRTF